MLVHWRHINYVTFVSPAVTWSILNDHDAKVIDIPDEPIGDGAQIRILIVDDHDVFGASLAFVLDSESDMRAIGVAGTAKRALEMAAASAPDVILLDQRLPDIDGVKIIRNLLELRPQAQVVMLTASTSDTSCSRRWRRVRPGSSTSRAAWGTW